MAGGHEGEVLLGVASFHGVATQAKPKTATIRCCCGARVLLMLNTSRYCPHCKQLLAWVDGG